VACNIVWVTVPITLIYQALRNSGDAAGSAKAKSA
jgi:hypothetical protein